MRKGLLLVLLLFQLATYAQEKENRILILLDGSSSMMEQWSKDQTRFKAASGIIFRLMDSIYQINNQVEFGLRVYGHQYPSQDNNCYDTKQEVMFSKDNRTQMSLRLESLHPYGISPIAYSLKEAAEKDLVTPDRYNYSIILITDGGESCNGNICQVAKELLQKKIIFKPYIIGLVAYAPLKEQYSCLGNYLQTSNDGEVTASVDTIVSAYRKVIPIITVTAKVVKPKEETIITTSVKPRPSIELLSSKQNKSLMVLIEILAPKKVNIFDTSFEHGYAKFINPTSEIYLSYKSNSTFQFYRIMKLPELQQSRRIKLPAGKYKVVFNKKTTSFGTETSKEFEIKKDMITEVQL